MSSRRQSGMALVLLLIMLSALSLLVVGLASEARTETRLAQIFVQRAQAKALARAAVLLALRDLQGGRNDTGSPLMRSYTLDGRAVQVELVPASALLSLKRAPIETLARLFRLVGGLSAADAEALAEDVGEARLGDARLTGAEGRSIAALEDLLLLPGMRRAVYEKVAPLLTVSASPASIDPRWAPDALLPVLAAESELSLQEIQRLREQERAGSTVPPVGGTVLASVSVSFGDGSSMTQRLEAVSGLAGRSGWTISRAYPVVAKRGAK